jgi:hypothetical protein
MKVYLFCMGFGIGMFFTILMFSTGKFVIGN